MPMMGSRGGGSIRGFGRFGKNLLLSIIDTLNRTTSGSLGTSSDGKAEWKNVRGTWQGNGSSAASQSAASGNNIAVVDMDGLVISNLQVDTSNTSGVGLSFWVTDSNSWWAATTSHASSAFSTTNCGGGPQSSSSCPAGCNACGGCGYYNVYYIWYVACTVGGQGAYITSNPNMNDTGTITSNSGCGPFQGQPQYRQTVETYGCNSSQQTLTGTNYTSNFKLLNNAGTLVNTQYNTNTSSFSSSGSIAISTVGNVITYSVYSAGNKGGSLLHTGAYTAISPTKGPGVGLFHGDGGSNQGSSVSNFSATVVI
jgi:hypothetical protein